MYLLHGIGELREWVAENKLSGKKLGFVPTMGYLHEGHITLMRTARDECDLVVASIFVNPIQFGENEDFDSYPRDLSHDMALAEAAGVDVIFAPSVGEMYPRGYNTFVEVNKLTDKLCGRSRPGHFRGVTTVVNKLFNIVQPDTAYFGQKDAQQVLVLKKMVEDLNMSLEIKVVNTVREPDGLAMSSRNAYLNQEERQAALVLYNSLMRVRELVKKGEKAKEILLNEVRREIEAEPLARIDYVEILSVPDLEGLDLLEGRCLVALAVFIGKTRLIDNIILEV